MVADVSFKRWGVDVFWNGRGGGVLARGERSASGAERGLTDVLDVVVVFVVKRGFSSLSSSITTRMFQSSSDSSSCDGRSITFGIESDGKATSLLPAFAVDKLDVRLEWGMEIMREMVCRQEL